MSRSLALIAGVLVVGTTAALGVHSATAPPPSIVTPLYAKDLVGIPGKELLMVKVRYEPGGADTAHRHDASVLVYVLEGAIDMQVEGGPLVTVKKGETFSEVPSDVHVVGQNASLSEPAEFLAILIKDKGAPPTAPAHAAD